MYTAVIVELVPDDTRALSAVVAKVTGLRDALASLIGRGDSQFLVACKRTNGANLRNGLIIGAAATVMLNSLARW